MARIAWCTILDLHGDEHRERRRVENRLFRRETFSYWEHQVLGETVQTTLGPFIEAGLGDRAQIGYRSALSLTATIAGIDHDPGRHRLDRAALYTVDDLLSWGVDHPDDLTLAQNDIGFVQRCMHESELDGGLEIDPGRPRDQQLFGTVAVMAHAYLSAGGRQDPADPPVLDPNSIRKHFSSYPVVFDAE